MVREKEIIEKIYDLIYSLEDASNYNKNVSCAIDFLDKYIKESLMNSQLKLVNEAILIDDVIGGDGSEIYVEFKSKSSRFIVNEELANSINKWIKTKG